jgi:hypothetical protein
MLVSGAMGLRFLDAGIFIHAGVNSTGIELSLAR